MTTQPTTKEELAKRWDAQSAGTKAQGRKMLDDLRKYLGKGNTELPPAITGRPGMHALAVTGWDWRKPGTGKHIAREVEPLISVIVQEQIIARSYRPKVLAEPVVWRLRATLRHEMLCHSYQTRLQVLTKGDTGLQKNWSYWDEIEIPEPAADVVMEDEEELRHTQLSDGKRIAAEKADMDTIAKVIKMVGNLGMARISLAKKSPLSWEVVQGLKQLVQVSDSNCLAQLVSKPVGIR
jgi:hypothetical protein